MIRPARFFLSLPAFLVLVSCALPAVKPTVLMPPFIDAPEAVADLTNAEKAVGDIRGTVTLKTFESDGTLSNSVTGYMAYKHPDKVRFTYIGPFGIVLFEALVNGPTTILFLPQQLLAYAGKSDAVKDSPFSPSLMGIAFRRPAGPVFVIEHDGAQSILYSISKSADRYDLVEKIVLDRLTMRPTVRESYEKGIGRYRISYMAYGQSGGVSVPTDITLEDLASGSRMEISIRDYIVNSGIGDEVFDTVVPPPYVEKPLDSFVPPVQ